MSNLNEELLYAKLVVLTKAIVDNEQKQLVKTLLDDLSEQLEERVGPQGKQGPIGPKGERGEIGPIGFDGEKGDQGLQEEVGPKGDKGEVGPKGDQGEVGPKGDKGDQGLVGPKGDKGDKGDQGLVGPKGDKGDKGEVGPKGDQGLQGEVGPKGDKGNKGDQGLVGPKGDKGDQGEVGPKGDKGLVGPKGPKGPKGDKGDPGNDANVDLVDEKVEKYQRDLSARITRVAQQVTAGGGSGAGSGSYSIMDQRDVVFKQSTDITDGSILSYSTSVSKYVANNTLNNIDHISFSTNTSYEVSQGEFAWNADEETMDLGLNGAVLQLGQEIHYHVRNNSGVDIDNGDAVMATGTLGASGRLTIAKAVANGSVASKYFLGIATEDIPNDTDGKVTHFGKVRGINTSPWNEGDLLYVDPANPGELITTPPSAPNWKLAAAIVISKNNNGTIFVRVSPEHKLGELVDVEIPTPSNNSVIYYNGVTSRWESREQSQLSIDHVTSNTTITFDNYTILANSTSNTIYVTLPDANTSNGFTCNIKKIDSSINNVVIQGANTLHLIDGSETVEINQQYTTITVQSDGSNWWII